MVRRILFPTFSQRYPLDNRESAQNQSSGFVRFAVMEKLVLEKLLKPSAAAEKVDVEHQLVP